ncbi:MAG: TonB family protein [Erythrobacter sp.]
MAWKHSVLAAFTIAGLAAAPAQAKDPVVLAPLGDWELAEPTPDACIAVRLFGSGDAAHVLRLEQNWPGSGAEFWVAGPSFERFMSYEKIAFRLQDGGKARTLRPLTGMLPGFGKTIITTLSNNAIATSLGIARTSAAEQGAGLELLDTDAAEGVEFVGMKRGSDAEVRLASGGLEAAFAMLNTCALGLLEQWGLDPAKHLAASQPARLLNEREIVGRMRKSYAEAGLATGERGRIKVRLMIDEAGKVEECVMIEAAVSAGLASPACEIMADARFDPPLDADGRAFRTFFVTPVEYRIAR